jgi:hypothetical protein
VATCLRNARVGEGTDDNTSRHVMDCLIDRRQDGFPMSLEVLSTGATAAHPDSGAAPNVTGDFVGLDEAVLRHNRDLYDRAHREVLYLPSCPSCSNPSASGTSVVGGRSTNVGVFLLVGCNLRKTGNKHRGMLDLPSTNTSTDLWNMGCGACCRRLDFPLAILDKHSACDARGRASTQCDHCMCMVEGIGSV